MAAPTEAVQKSLRHYVEEHRRGTFAVGAPNDDVAEVTGRPAEDFETVARRYAAQIDARPTLANRLRTVGMFMRVPLVPSRDLDRLAREGHYPEPPRALLCADAPAWRDERTSVAVA